MQLFTSLMAPAGTFIKSLVYFTRRHRHNNTPVHNRNQMAKLKFGSIVTTGSGSLGGHTIQHSKGGMQLRNKPIPRSTATDAQRSIRSINPVLQAGWRALTPAQQKIWNDWPVIHGIFNAKGDKHPLSGHSLWMKYQYGRLIEYLPFLSHPSLYLPNYFGPETVINGSFSIDANWLKGPYWSIHDGRAYCNRPVVGSSYLIQTSLLLLPFNTYRITLDVYNMIGFFQFYFGAFGGFTLINGYNIKNFYVGNYNTQFFLFATNICSASFDNISAKKIFNF